MLLAGQLHIPMVADDGIGLTDNAMINLQQSHLLVTHFQAVRCAFALGAPSTTVCLHTEPLSLPVEAGLLERSRCRSDQSSAW